MKSLSSYRFLFFALIPLLFFLAFVASCDTDKEVPAKQDDQSQYIDIGGQKAKIDLGPSTPNDFVVLGKEAFVDEQLILPKGTKIEKIKDDPYSFAYTLPQGYSITGKNGRIAAGVLATAGKVTCKCTKGSGCSPFVFSLQQITVGCLMNDQCTACTKIVSARVGAEDVEITDSQLIDFTQDIHFVTEKSELAKSKCISSAILDVKEVQEGLRKFLYSYQGKNTEQLYKATSIEEMPSNYEFVAVSVYGRVLLAPMDKTLSFFLTNPVTNDGYVSRARLAAKQSCKCNAGTGCTKGKKTVPFIGSVVYCEAGKCTDCTLTY
ncbi:hypothetical protein LC612_40645 [Nostoc sp. CHAB 5834]|nr:hypothetical protein [Nostoc sp. CHAB 5834]